MKFGKILNSILKFLARVGPVVGLTLLAVLIVGEILGWSDTTDIVPPILPEIQKKAVSLPREPQLIPPDLPIIGPKEMVQPGDIPLTSPQLPSIERRSLQPPQISFLEQPQLSEVGWPEVQEFKDFRGGLDLSTYKTKVPPNRATYLMNALWNEQGEMYKRPGFDTLVVTPEEFNFVYRYYQQDGDKYLMGGSDTALYFWQEDSASWTWLAGTGGTSGRWDGCTFQDMFIGAHEGIAPIAWDGSELINVGEQSYSYDSSWAANCTLYVHVTDVAWDDDQFVGFYAVQSSPSYSDSGMPFGQIVHNTLDVFAIRYNATSGTNLWEADRNVTILSALEDSVWAAGVIDTFYTMSEHQSEVLLPNNDTLRSEWTAVPAGSHYVTINDHPDTSSHDDYIHTGDTADVDIFCLDDQGSSLTDVAKIWIRFISSTNNEYNPTTLDFRLCYPDTNSCRKYLVQIANGIESETEPDVKTYQLHSAQFSTSPQGVSWYSSNLDSIMIYLKPHVLPCYDGCEIEIYDLWVGVGYEQYDVACGFMVYDSSLFDEAGLLDNDITVPTYFELIPAGYGGVGSPSKKTREIIDIDSGIYTSEVWGNLAYLKLAGPEISGLAVGDSFQLRHLYFPTSKYVENYDEALWIGWAGTGADQNKNVVLYSAPSDIANWPPGNEIYIESDDGDYITGMIQFYPDQQGHRSEPWAELVVSKEQSLYRIYPVTYAGEQDYATMFISRGVGCCSNSAMAMIEGKFIAFPDQHGVWLYNGTGVQPISLLIDPIFEAWDISNLEYASAIYNPQDRHYYLSYPPGANDSTIFIVWEDLRASGALYEIYGQRYSTNLDTLGANFAINDDAPAGDHYKEYPAIDMNAYGNAVVVWTDNRDGDGVPGYVYGQRYNNAGQTVGSNFRVTTTYPARGEWPSVAIMPDNSFLVVWTDLRCKCEAQGYQDTCPAPPTCPAEDHINLYSIYGQAYSSSGSPVGGNFEITDTDYPETSVGEETDIASNYYGSYVAVWEDGRDDNGIDVYGQRLTSAGRLGANFKVSEYDGINAIADPRVAMARDGRFVVCWYSQEGGYHPWCQLYDSTATKVGNNFRADTGFTVAGVPDVGMNPVTGDFVVAFTSIVNTNVYVFAQRFLADGTFNGDSIWVTVSPASYTDVNVVMDEDGEFIVSYLSAAGPHPVMFQCLCADGSRHGNPIIASDVSSVKNAPALSGKFDCVPASTMNTLAYNIDHHGWSWESFSASAYAYQHGLTDTVKVIFAESGTNTIQNYGVQADDEDDPVILTYQSPYLPFVQNPSWEVVMSYATLEAFLDTGEVYVYWYKDYSELVHIDTITCGLNCRKEMQLPSEVAGHNISMKIITGSEIEDFTLSGYWWEYLINRCRE